MADDESNRVRLRIRLCSPPDRVFEYLSSDAGRAKFWAASAAERDGHVEFRFDNGMRQRGKVLRREPPRLFAVEYFGGSEARFELSADGAGGTDLVLTESAIPAHSLEDQRAGWVTVLLCLKAAVDFSIDLRNRDPERTWENGYVDV